MADPRTILSLCAGVGGLELGIMLALHHRGEAGRGICYVEREAAAAASLGASMEAGWLHPAPVWCDLATFDGRPWRGVVDILASGDPCQDNSVAGKRAGSGGQRFLAPEVCRIAKECRPDLIVRENVPGNAAEQLHALVPALERLGYRVAAGVFSSAATGNTMRRERLFVMAVADGGCGAHREEQHRGEQRLFAQGDGAGDGDAGEPVAGAERRQLQRRGGSRQLRREESSDRGEGHQRQRDGGLAGNSGSEGSDDAARPAVARLPLGQQPEVGRGAVGHQGPAAGARGGAALPPAVVPGPADPRWRDVLDRFPELQPALSEEEAQSHLRRGVDAMANRVERLRATGNGVDPITAAYAFLCLDRKLRECHQP